MSVLHLYCCCVRTTDEQPEKGGSCGELLEQQLYMHCVCVCCVEVNETPLVVRMGRRMQITAAKLLFP
jgi:hypothetical protein